MNGTYELVDDRPTLRFERALAHPVDKVWRALTEPAELKHWFPSDVELDLRVGGRMNFVFREEDVDKAKEALGLDPGDTLPPMVGEITAVDPPRHFAFTWNDDQLDFELESTDEGCRLRFTVVLDEEKKAARDAAGWHVCLDRLEQSLGGEDTVGPGAEPTDEWQGHYEEYQRQGLPAGAPLPS